MNDTFDNCTFSNFDNYVLDVSNVKNATKGSLELEKSQSVTKSDVSFDDSLFLNTQLLTLLKDNEDSCSQAICNGNNPPLENKAAKLSQNCKNGDLSEEKDCHPEVRNTNDSLQDDMFNEPQVRSPNRETVSTGTIYSTRQPPTRLRRPFQNPAPLRLANCHHGGCHDPSWKNTPPARFPLCSRGKWSVSTTRKSSNITPI
jgi:hypothetical protein